MQSLKQGCKLVSIHKWPFSAISASIYGVACAAYYMYASAQPVDFLDLAKNCSFMNWKLSSAYYCIMDGHKVTATLF